MEAQAKLPGTTPLPGTGDFFQNDNSPCSRAGMIYQNDPDAKPAWRGNPIKLCGPKEAISLGPPREADEANTKIFRIRFIGRRRIPP